MRAILKIYGRVQGVSFRYSSREKAQELNLSGWVRNERDGTVQIVAEGEEKDLKELIEWCKSTAPAPDQREGGQGSYYAMVEKVDVEWRKSTGEFDGFVVR